MARERPKRYETLRDGSRAELAAWVVQAPEQRKGEFVLVVAGANRGDQQAECLLDPRSVLDILADELPAPQAVRLAGRLTGRPRNELYRWVLERRGTAKK